MRVSYCQWGWAFVGILAWGLLRPILAQNKAPEFGRPNPPNAVPRAAGYAPVLPQSMIRLAFSPDHRVLASASADETVGLWDIQTGKLLTQLTGDGSHDLRFSPDGWMLGAAGQNGSYRLWEVSSGGLLVESERTPNIAGGVAGRFSPELDRLVLGSSQDTVDVVETATGNRLPAIQIFKQGAIGAIAFSAEENLLAVGSGFSRDSSRPPMNQVLVWDLTENKLSRELSNPILREGLSRADTFRRLEFSTDGSTLAAMHSRRGLLFWNVDQGFNWPSIPMSQDELFAISGDGKTLVRLKPSSPSNIELVEIATGGVYQTLDIEKPVSALELSPDGRFLAAGSKDTRDVFIRELPQAALKEAPAEEELKQASERIAQTNAQPAREGMAVLVAAGDRSVPILAPFLQLNEIQSKRNEEVRRLIQELDNDDFFSRENATNKLRALGEAAVPALKSELEKNPPLEVATRIQAVLKQSKKSVPALSGETLRRIRAIEVLEKIGTEQARALLEQIAKGPQSARESHEAALALKRLRRMTADR